VAVRTVVEAGCGSAQRQPSLLGLSRVVLEAFNKVERRGALRTWGLWVGTLVALLLYERRVHRSGKALCLLGLRRGRVASAAASLVVVSGVLGTISGALALSLVAIVVLAFSPLAWNGIRDLPARLYLARATPEGAHVYLHSFASTQPGAGAEVLRQICVEADFSATALALDAGSPRLVDYYRAFGFGTCGRPVTGRRGSQLQRMWRPPRRPIGEQDFQEIVPSRQGAASS